MYPLGYQSTTTTRQAISVSPTDGSTYSSTSETFGTVKTISGSTVGHNNIIHTTYYNTVILDGGSVSELKSKASAIYYSYFMYVIYLIMRLF